jgi:colanic acid/amylovoran biosynthesis glycosyltransferase
MNQPSLPRTIVLERQMKSGAECRLVAYLVNQYPKVSHSFIRREIRALERLGVAVQRISIRGWDEPLVEPEDVEERQKTAYVLRDGLTPLLGSLARMLVRRPKQTLAAFATAVRMSVRADKPLPVHLIYVVQACRILEWLERSGATHLHAHFGTNPAEVAMYVRLLGGPPYSFTVHGPEEFDKAPMLKLDQKTAHASAVVAISSFGRSQLFRWIPPADWPKVKVVHCGLERGFEASSVKPCEDARFVCVGRLTEQKGQLLLLDAFRLVVDDHPRCRLVLAGDGEMRPDIERRIRDLDLVDNVLVTGWVSGCEVRDEILAARALVLPSFQEGLPVVIMEAMALGRPVISTYVAGIPELVTPETGWLVPAGGVDDLANAMRLCLNCTAAKLTVMGEAARVRVRSRHSADRSAEKMVELFLDAQEPLSVV